MLRAQNATFVANQSGYTKTRSDLRRGVGGRGIGPLLQVAVGTSGLSITLAYRSSEFSSHGRFRCDG